MSFTPLRWGVDSLYLSYPGKLAKQWYEKLTALKLLAQSSDAREAASAQLAIGGHLFEVKDRGTRRFAYVLEDNWFRLEVSTGGETGLPLAYAKVSSELLTNVGVVDAEKDLRFIINTLGMMYEGANISRVDLFVDFVSEVPMNSWGPEAWITRAHHIHQYTIQDRFSGWTVGRGGALSARLYDKTLELAKSHKDYLIDLWMAAGWDRSQPVWRLEFQYCRKVLVELGIIKLDHLMAQFDPLWRYATTSWLRLSVPNVSDETRTRWPTHPLWESFAQLDWGNMPAPALQRVRKDRAPSDEVLFSQGIAGLTSFMAREGITEMHIGVNKFLAAAQVFHNSREGLTGKRFPRYVKDKVLAKGKRYNTLNNIRPDPKDEEANAARAKAYRKAKDGD